MSVDSAGETQSCLAIGKNKGAASYAPIMQNLLPPSGLTKHPEGLSNPSIYWLQIIGVAQDGHGWVRLASGGPTQHGKSERCPKIAKTYMGHKEGSSSLTKHLRRSQQPLNLQNFGTIQDGHGWVILALRSSNR